MMNDLMLNEDGSDCSDQDLGDFYSSQPGDIISATTTHRRTHRKAGVSLVAVGALLILGGVGAAFFGKGEEVAEENELKHKDKYGPTPAPRPISADIPRPTLAPTPAYVPDVNPDQVPDGAAETSEPTKSPTASPVDATTDAPTSTDLFVFLSDFIGQDQLSDPESISNSAYTWLLDNENLNSYDDAQLKQRFAMACLYYATNVDQSWEVDDGWLSDDDECTWHGAACENGFLITLNMTANGLTGLIPNEITLLKDYLLSLELADNDLVNTNKELAWIGELQKLRMLVLSNTLFASDGIPTYIGKLSDLRILDVSSSLFYGELDGATFEPLKELIYLELGDNWYNSTMPQEIPALPKLEALYTYQAGLEGTLDFLVGMPSIFELWLDDNPGLIGSIPTEVGTLSTLASLSLSNCDLTGQIPSEIGKLSLMEQMWLFGNWFTGVIPPEIGQLTSLEILGLEDNNITDTVMPDEICNLNLIALGADCRGDWSLECDCCTCCEPPCPVVNLPLYDSARRLKSLF